MILMFCILIVTILLFLWGKFTPDIVALVSMLSLYLFGILDLSETLSGFSNPTVLMIAALFIIGEGLSWTSVHQRQECHGGLSFFALTPATVNSNF